MKPPSLPGGLHVKVRYISNGETVYYVLKKNNTTIKKDKRLTLEYLQCVPLLM